MQNLLEELAKYHDEWIKIAYAFFNNKEDAEDLVQDFYIDMYKYNVQLDNVRYGNNDINRYFIYTSLKYLALDKIKKRKPDIIYVDYIADNEGDASILDEYEGILLDIDKEMERWTWYDRTLFEMYMYSGLSMRDIAYGTEKDFRWISKDKKICDHSIINGTGISLSSIYNTIKRCKERIKSNVIPNTKKEK